VINNNNNNNNSVIKSRSVNNVAKQFIPIMVKRIGVDISVLYRCDIRSSGSQ
jgi:hypothetical protein